jgi:DMSO/TMAO reductase YedYZ molybdopterin-dependent catalytic subunit
MSTVALDRLLAILLAAQLATGLLTLRAGVPATLPLFILHGLLGGTLLAAIGLKLARSVPVAWRRRRWGRVSLGGLLAFGALAAVGGGFAWVASGRILSVGPWTVLTLHVWAALALVPILAVHLLPHRWRLLRPRNRPRSPGGRLPRRAFLAGGALALAGAGAVVAANVLDRVRGGVRRFTGSRWLPDGGVPPPTTFYGEGAPTIDAQAWRLRVTGAVANDLELDLDELAAIGEVERSAVLDCTSGWALRTSWHGVPLGAVLEAAGPRRAMPRVRIASVTGWNVILEPHELGDALLATRVAGDPLPVANGAPCRLVAPTRRGLDWIKWVDEVRVI